MQNLLYLINYFGISVDESTPIIILYAAYHLIISVILILNVLNISMYLLSIYILNHEIFLSLIPEKYGFIFKLISFYKNIRIGFIVFEVFLLIIVLLIMFIVNYGIVSLYLENK